MPETNPLPLPLKALCGGVAGSSVLFVQPLDVIKTRNESVLNIQHTTPVSASTRGSVSKLASNRGLQRRYSNMLQSARTIIKEEGVTGLWRGTRPTLAYAIPSGAIFFSCLSLLSDSFKQWSHIPASHALPMHLALLSGALARGVATASLSPLIMIKSRLESVEGLRKYGDRPTLLHTTRQIIAEEGFLSLYRGLSATLARDVPWAAIQFVTYNAANQHLRGVYISRQNTSSSPSAAAPPSSLSSSTSSTSSTSSSSPSTSTSTSSSSSSSSSSVVSASLISSVSGALGGAVACLLTQPFDVCKTRIQLQPLLQAAAQGAASSASATGSSEKVANTCAHTHGNRNRNGSGSGHGKGQLSARAPSVWRMMAEIYRQEGPQTFLRGLGPRLARRMALPAIAWPIYTQSVERMQHAYTVDDI